MDTSNPRTVNVATQEVSLCGNEVIFNESTDGKESNYKSVFEGPEASPRIFVPDVLAEWPWPRRIHPDYAEIENESRVWISSFKAFSNEAQDAFDRGKFSLLGCLCNCNSTREHARASSDLLQIFFLLDEYSDISTPSEIRKQQEAVLDAFRNPHNPRPKGEWVGGEVARQFWINHIQNAKEPAKKRLIQSMDEFYDGLIQQSVDRRKRRVLDMKTYICERRRTIGAKPMFHINELEFEIPDEVMAHSTVQQMILSACDLIALSNDIASYNVEQRRGDELHNIITIAMNEYHTNVNGAMLYIQYQVSEVSEIFLTAMASLPEWEEPLNSQVRKYCDGLGEWVRGNHDWNFESERYFGNMGLEIRKNKWMSLLPKKRGEEVGPMRVDSSIL